MQDEKIMPESARGLEHPGVLDALVRDEQSGRVLLVMFERRPWTGGEFQLWQLQEKLNAYVSFALDGEMAEQHPELAGRPLCLQLRSVHEPSGEALGLVESARQQLALMEIEFEVWHIGDDGGGACGCGQPSCEKEG